MKSLADYLKEMEPPKYVKPQFGWNFDEWCEDNNISEPTNEDIEWYMMNSWFRTGSRIDSMSDMNPMHYINEMLNSVTLERLIFHLRSRFTKYSFRYNGAHKNDICDSEIRISTDLYNNEKDFDRFCKTMEIMMWEYSHSIPKKSDNQFTTIIISPFQVQDITKKIMTEGRGLVYHVCSKESAKSIMKTGLRPKGKYTKNHPKYRNFQNRVHFIWGHDDREVSNLIGSIIRDKHFRPEDISIIKLDLNKHKCNVSFYVDSEYNDEYSVYTYAYFPPQFLELETMD